MLIEFFVVANTNLEFLVWRCEKMSDCYLQGNAFFGRSTKRLLDRIPPLSIIIIDHEDIDTVAAEDMIRKEVKAVFNKQTSFSGAIHRTGLLLLLENGIPVFDMGSSLTFSYEQKIKVIGNKMYIEKDSEWYFADIIFSYTYEEVLKKLHLGEKNYPSLFECFTENSFQYGLKETKHFLNALEGLPRLNEINNKFVFIVARGFQMEEEIKAARDFMLHSQCVTIAVDGAASLLEKYRIQPKFIIGDMDSLSDVYQYENSIFIAHSYLNGKSPGHLRLKERSIDSMTVPFPGLSEDLAIMIAAVSNADHIFTIGCRTSAIELIEKGRKGMASTLLTRMFIGERISDWKGLHKLFSLRNIPALKNIFLTELLQEEYKVDEG